MESFFRGAKPGYKWEPAKSCRPDKILQKPSPFAIGQNYDLPVLKRSQSEPKWKPHTVESRLSKYSVNDKEFVEGIRMYPPPEQVDRSHWLCQVNSATNYYNIINGREMDQFNKKFRHQELQNLEVLTTPGQAAGQIQPQQPVHSVNNLPALGHRIYTK